MKKKLSSIIVSVVICLLIALMAMGVVTSSASTISNETDYYSYKEDYIKNYCKYDYLVDDMRLPYRDFVETLDQDKAFQIELAAWQVATINPDTFYSVVSQTQQCKYYEAIILDLLFQETQTENYVQNIKSFIESSQVSSYSKFLDFNSKQMQNYLDDIGPSVRECILKENIDNWNGVLKYVDKIGEYSGYVSDAIDLYNKLCKVEVIEDMSQGYSNVLTAMSNRTDNIYLKAALKNVGLIFSEDLTDEQLKYIFASEAGIEAVYKEFMKQLKSVAVKELGLTGIAIDLAQSAGKAIAESWFGASTMASDYYQMKAMYEIEDLLRAVVKNSSGETFCSAFKMYENVCLMGCDYSKKYVEPLYTSAFGRLFGWATNQNYELYASQLDQLKSDIAFTFEMIDVGADSWYVIDTQETTTMASVNPYYSYNTYSANDYYAEYEELKPQVYSAYGSNMGNDITLTEDMLINNNFEFTGGTINLNGHTLTVNGNLIQSGGEMYIDGGTLEVNGDYRIQSYVKNETTDKMEYTGSDGIIRMTKDADIVKIKGDFCTQSDYYCTSNIGTYNVLVAGTMEIGGDFRQIRNTHSDNFACYGTHTVVLNGSGKQNVYFESNSSKFNNLEVSNNNITWSGYMNITELKSNLTIDSDDLSIYYLKMNGNKVTINDDVKIYSNKVDIDRGYLKINGNLLQPSGEMYIDGGTLEVNGDYRIQSYVKNETTDKMEYTGSDGIIRMTKDADIVKIKGDFCTQSDYYCTSNIGTYNVLVAGTMEIGGDFRQIRNTHSDNFACYGTHTVVLNGSDIQNVHFDSTSSYFNNLKLTKDKDTGYIFKPDNCWKNLYLDTDVEAVNITSDIKSLKPMEIYTLSAIVEGINKPSQEVIWKLTGNTDKSTALDKFGILTIGENEKADKITITATSIADNTKSDTIELTIDRPDPVVLGVRINPTVVSAVNGETCQFKAITYGLYKPAQGVIWSVSANTSKNTSINSDGLLAEDETAEKVTVTATSTADKTKSASVTVDIFQIKIISTVSNVTVTMATGETQQLQAVVTGSNNPNQKVVWTVGGNKSINTVINENGELTIGEDETAKTIIVRATSVENPEKYGEFAINISTNDEPKYQIGDTNLDGSITISDVTAIQRHLAEIEVFNDEQLALADTNGDGEIDITDATYLQMYLAEFDGIVLGKQTA